MSDLAELQELLRPFGLRSADFVPLDPLAANRSRVRDVRYLDLIRRSQYRPAIYPLAVIENQHRPSVYVTSNAHLGEDTAAVASLRRTLAFRSDAEHLAVAEPGRLSLYSLDLDAGDTPRVILETAPEARTLLSSLAFPLENPSAGSPVAGKVRDILLKLLTGATRVLRKAEVDPLDSLSLSGRALFLRFLADRGVLDGISPRSICPYASRYEQCFQDGRSAAATCEWLDEKFNGDFLPLSHGNSVRWFNTLPPAVYNALKDILLRAPDGQMALQWKARWADLLFEHIPVGLLSQVYEQHAHLYTPNRARKTGVYYTPHHIAEYMVEEVFSTLENKRAAKATVLDPASGGGVFLVAAFRRLAAEHWSLTGTPPDSAALRKILYEQLRGFDISEPALRLCSLGLYLTAIELDPNPHPPAKLGFPIPLLKTVLLNVSSPNEEHRYIGSLGEHVSSDHDNQYDIVIGNPPWTSWKTPKAGEDEDEKDGSEDLPSEDLSDETDPLAAQIREVERVITPIVRQRLGADHKPYEMLDRVPDLPFLWRAQNWARKGEGRIAFALHGRLLFKRTSKGKDARHDLLKSLRVTAIINGTALRQTDYWPTVDPPFCLLFARNIKPREDELFYFLSPALERPLNDRGQLRIDAANAEPVSVSVLRETPTLFKTLFRGTALDAAVMQKIRRHAPQTLSEVWSANRWSPKRHIGLGFQVKGGDKGSVEHLKGLSELTKANAHKTPYLIRPAQLDPFAHKSLHRPRREWIYKTPLVLVDESPAIERTASSCYAYLSLERVAYNESFIGISCAEDKFHPELLARYLFLIFNSQIPLYVALQTSAQFGVERDALYVEDVRQTPIRDLNDLSPGDRSGILEMSDALIRDPVANLSRVESWVAGLYSLGPKDREVIKDTLDVELPFTVNTQRAQTRATEPQISAFVSRVQSILDPFCAMRGRSVRVRLMRNVLEEPWVFLQIDAFAQGSTAPSDMFTSAEIVKKADSLAATQIIEQARRGTLLLGIVSAYRYFTPSRARLLGNLILDDEHGHFGWLVGGR